MRRQVVHAYRCVVRPECTHDRRLIVGAAGLHVDERRRVVTADGGKGAPEQVPPGLELLEHVGVAGDDRGPTPRATP